MLFRSARVPAHLKQNYGYDIRTAAARRGISIAEAIAHRVAQWRAAHNADPDAGWNILADWLETDATDLAGYLDGLPNPLPAPTRVRALDPGDNGPAPAGTPVLDAPAPETRPAAKGRTGK